MAKAIKGHYKANTKQRCPMLNIDHKKGYVQGWLSVAHNLRVTEKPLEALEGDLRAFYYVLYLNYGQGN